MSGIEIRNPVFSSADNSLIDVEFDHPTLGWIPFTASSLDVEPVSVAIHALALTMGVAPYNEPDPVPRELTPVTRRQLRLTLVRNGISLGGVEAMITAMPDGMQKDEALIEWEDAQTFERHHPTLLLIAQGLELTPAKVDKMWLEAMAA